MRGHLAICLRDPGNELVSAECRQLTGGEPDQIGHASCDTLDRVGDAAYVRYGARAIVETETVDALLRWLREVDFQADDFRLKVVDLPDERLPSTRRLIVAVANAIHGRPKLDHPRQELLLTVGPQGLWFGEIVAEATRSYRRHQAKPHSTAGSLPPRLARALVNLVAPAASSILNPCCGTGSILLEACALGLQAFGADSNPRMVGMSQLNLAHFDYAAPVEQIDARSWTRTADALIADLPYGRSRIWDETTALDLLKNAASQAPIAVFVAARDISGWLEQAGYRDIELFRVQKSGGFSRCVHRAQAT